MKDYKISNRANIRGGGIQIALLLLFVLLLAPMAAAQDNDKPTVAFLRYGPYLPDPIVENGLLDTLLVYEWITAEERALLNARQNFEGEKININWASANFDLPTVNIMVEDALDRGADILITAGAPVTQIAINITEDQEEPTPILFHSVYHPTQFGISDAPCIKPAHVTGSEYTPPYEEAFEVFLLQNPALKRVGTLHTSTDAGGNYGAGRISAIAEAQGIEVESAAISSLSDLRAAVQGLVNKDVEAIMLPVDFTIGSGLPIVVSVAKENQIPVFYPIPGTVLTGVTIGVGFNEYYEQGVHAGLLLDARLKGALDFASTAVLSQTGGTVGINLDVAAEMGIDFPQELQDMADITLRDGAVLLSEQAITQLLDSLGANEEFKQMTLAMLRSLGDSFDWAPLMMPDLDAEASPIAAQMMAQLSMVLEMRKSPEHRAADAAVLESLHCNDEMIAEQQAALDAAE